jgi:hypothetical protein
MALPSGDIFFLDNFAIRQWDDPFYAGTRVKYDKTDFVTKVHEYHRDGAQLVDGYAPFCKHVFVPNFIGAKVGSVPITVENQKLVRTAYESRRPEELAVLSRCGDGCAERVSCTALTSTVLMCALVQSYRRCMFHIAVDHHHGTSRDCTRLWVT